MSRNNNFKQSKQSEPIKKFCKVCQDAGKTESEYRSHFTRETPDPHSKVVCPTLLALECRFCFKKGHTVKYCAILKERDRASARAEREIEKPKKAVEKPKGKPTNMFSCLESDSEEEQEIVQKQVVEEFPALAAPSMTRTNVEDFPVLSVPSMSRSSSIATNYASAVAKPAQPKPVAYTKPVALPAIKVESKPAPWAYSGKSASLLDWAALDSDSDDEEESAPPANTDYDSDW